VVAGLFLAAPSAPPPPPTARPEPGHLSHTWIGWDGSRWDLTGDRVPSGVLLGQGIRGLGAGPGQHLTSTSPALAGARWRGAQETPREPFWPLSVYQGDRGQAWLDYDAAFWRTMDRRRPGTWVATQPNGTSRYLRMRFTDDGDHPVALPGDVWGRQAYGISFLAEQPFWEGEPVVVAPLGNPLQRNFFGGGDQSLPGYGPPFFIGSGASLSRARISNPGDQPAWPVWVVVGPVTSAVVGLDGRAVQVPLQVLPGRALVIDSAPDAQWALEGDVVLDETGAPQLDETGRVVVRNLGTPGHEGDRTRELGSRVEWAPVPARAENVPLQTSIVGTGAVQPSLVPLHDRAW